MTVQAGLTVTLPASPPAFLALHAAGALEQTLLDLVEAFQIVHQQRGRKADVLSYDVEHASAKSKLKEFAELSKQPLDRRQGRNLRWFQQRIKFVDITRSPRLAHMSACTRANQPLGHADSRAFRTFGFLFQIHVAQQTPRRLLGHDARQRVRKHVVMHVRFA